jgi:hypothetical protein
MFEFDRHYSRSTINIFAIMDADDFDGIVAERPVDNAPITDAETEQWRIVSFELLYIPHAGFVEASQRLLRAQGGSRSMARMSARAFAAKSGPRRATRAAIDRAAHAPVGVPVADQAPSATSFPLWPTLAV